MRLSATPCFSDTLGQGCHNRHSKARNPALIFPADKDLQLLIHPTK